MSAADEGLRRARKELAAAQLLVTNSFAAQAVSRAYYGAFYAAEAALASIGEERSKRSGVVATVGQVLVRERGLDEKAGRLLRSLFERRSQADYLTDDVPREEGQRAVDDAGVVIDVIERWLRSAP